jgi:hypothetical protein
MVTLPRCNIARPATLYYHKMAENSGAMKIMLVEIKWHDKTQHTLLCRIEGAWTYSGYNHAYRQLIDYARQIPDKINLLCDLTKADAPLEDVALLRVSPFIHHAVIVTHDSQHSVVKQMARILHTQNPAMFLSHAPDMTHAMLKIQRTAAVGT